MAKNNSKNTKAKTNFQDLTNLEDLGEFLHQENTTIDRRFKEANRLPDLPSAEQDQAEPEYFQEETHFEAEEESHFEQDETTSEETNFDFTKNEVKEETLVELEPSEEEAFQEFIAKENTESSEVELAEELELFGKEENEINENSFNEEIAEETPEEFNDKVIEEIQSENSYLLDQAPTEHFDVVANPAFSLMVNDVDMEREQDIIDILDEFGLLKMNQEKDYRMAIQNGSILISQLSEFLAIHLAIKLNRYGGIVKLGPSDLIYSSRAAGPSDSRGKISKRIKDHKKKGSHQFNETGFAQNLEGEIQVFLSNDLGSAYTLLNKISPIFSSAVLEEDELERSTYARTALKTENVPENDVPLFIRYSEYLDQVKVELAEKLKEKARVKTWVNKTKNL